MQLPLPIADLEIAQESVLPPSAGHRIYCNRSLRLDQIDMVGFDMDYTLAIYVQSEMDRLSIEATARKLVERGHSEELLTMPYRTDFPVRGLLIDRKLGNVLKMDRYKYVKKAFHGMRELTREERRQLYQPRRLRGGTKRFHWVDTLYGLCEVSVYAAAIDALEARGEKVDYDALFGDVRECIDFAHRDGSILNEVTSDLSRFIIRDPELGPTLHSLRSSGKRLFLLTNSYPEYTHTMMTYLVGDAMPEYPSWKNYFDLVMTAAQKPKFFTERAPFLEVLSGQTDTRPARSLDRGRTYMNGNIVDFENFTGLRGDRILYVGDHIFGDVLRAKKESAWRTIMIIQELEEELAALEASRPDIERVDALEAIRTRLLDELREQKFRLKAVQRRLDGQAAGSDPALEAVRIRLRRTIDRLRVRLKAANAEIEQLEQGIDTRFHPYWGPLLKAGPEVSSFGDQIEMYACLYTKRVSNLLYYSPMHYFRSPRHRMPHEAAPQGRD